MEVEEIKYTLLKHCYEDDSVDSKHFASTHDLDAKLVLGLLEELVDENAVLKLFNSADNISVESGPNTRKAMVHYKSKINPVTKSKKLNSELKTMHYHTRIFYFQKDSEYIYNYTLEELKAKILNPYSYGKNIFVKGGTIKLDSIERIQIMHTGLTIEETVNNMNSTIVAENKRKAYLGGSQKRANTRKYQAFERGKDMTEQLILGPPGYKNEREMKAAAPSTEQPSNEPRIFIVHGHNDGLLQTVARVIEHQGIKPIILKEQPSKGLTIIEKFEANAKSDFAIVLLTADDKGNVKTEDEMNPRARQNVIFEMGYFFALLGRANVVCLQESGIEVPSDLGGRMYVKIDENDKWKYTLIKELKEAGFDVTADKI